MKRVELIYLIDIAIMLVISIVLLGIVTSSYFIKKNQINDSSMIIFKKPIIPKKETIEVTTAGDCTLGTDTNFGYSGQFDWWFKNKANGDYGYFFEKVKSFFTNDDYSYVNLEGTLTTYNKKTPKKYNFRGDPSYVNILKSGDIEGVNIANNHSNDYGIIGYNDTMKYLDEAMIDYFGYDHVLIKEIKGKRIAIVGYTSVGLWVSKKDDFAKTIKNLKDSNLADIVIANFHWGIEYSHSVTQSQRLWAHLAIDSGADIVIGSHPHCLQGIEVYHDKYIVYSLGNFVFGGNSSPKQIGRECLIVKMYFNYLDDKLEDIKIKIIPCSISSINSRNNYQPMPVTGSIKEKMINTVNKYSINYKYEESGD